MTLLELTVVILVLLTLITVLFMSAKAWKKGSDRALCVMNLQNVQKGVRGYMNLYGYAPGQTVSGLKSKVIGLGCYVESEPACPRDGVYTFGGDVIPPIGNLYMSCSLAASETHEPANSIDW